MAVTNAITDLIQSIGELLSSVFGAAYAIVHSFISGVLGLFAGFFAFVGDLAKGVVDLTGGVGKFVAGRFFFSCQPRSTLTDPGNAVFLAVVAAAGYAYMRFVRPQQARKPAVTNGVGAGKKAN
jgi:phage-related protein